MQKILPTTYLLVAILAMVGLRFLYPGVTIISSPWNFLGIVPLVFGVWINLAADKAFHQAGTTVKPFEQPSALLTGGAHRITRNPMYLGFVAILIGVGCLLEVLTPFLIVVVFAILMDQLFIRQEEHALERTFGNTWLEYKERVRRWI
jgi:protein-S-isoprenylcysteine O-methyltransferase Ste14